VSGLYHAACVLAPPGSIRPLAGRHAGAFLTGWRGVDQGGLEPCDSHPLGNRNQFHGFAPNPKVSSLPWRDHCLVRRGRPSSAGEWRIKDRPATRPGIALFAAEPLSTHLPYRSTLYSDSRRESDTIFFRLCHKGRGVVCQQKLLLDELVRRAAHGVDVRLTGGIALLD